MGPIGVNRNHEMIPAAEMRNLTEKILYLIAELKIHADKYLSTCGFLGGVDFSACREILSIVDISGCVAGRIDFSACRWVLSIYIKKNGPGQCSAHGCHLSWIAERSGSGFASKISQPDSANPTPATRFRRNSPLSFTLHLSRPSLPLSCP